MGEFVAAAHDLYAGIRAGCLSQAFGSPEYGLERLGGRLWHILSQTTTRQFSLLERPDDLWVVLQEPQGNPSALFFDP
jgi:hypothetical protein